MMVSRASNGIVCLVNCHVTCLLVFLCFCLISGKDDSRRVMLVCVIISMLLKKRFPKMGLLQRAISVLLYGNGCSKQVCLLIILMLF